MITTPERYTPAATHELADFSDTTDTLYHALAAAYTRDCQFYGMNRPWSSIEVRLAEGYRIESNVIGLAEQMIPCTVYSSPVPPPDGHAWEIVVVRQQHESRNLSIIGPLR